MVLKVFIVLWVILALIMVLFFLFSVLLPAMKSASFPVDEPIFSQCELYGEGERGASYTCRPQSYDASGYPLYPNSAQAGNGAAGGVNVSDMRAVIACALCAEYDKNMTIFDKTHSCRTIHEVCLSLSDCDSMCIGAGDCVAVCPQSAIIIKKYGKRRIAQVTDLCCGCGECAAVCPQNAIKMVKSNEVSSECTACKMDIKTQRPSAHGFLRNIVCSLSSFSTNQRKIAGGTQLFDAAKMGKNKKAASTGGFKREET